MAALSRLLLDFTHPVGSYYWSSDDTDPSQIFGGTWTQITGRFVLAAGGGYKAGSTGGASSVTLGISEIPSHTHSISASASSSGSHYHNIGCDYDGAGGSIYATIHKSASSSPGYWAEGLPQTDRILTALQVRLLPQEAEALTTICRLT